VPRQAGSRLSSQTLGVVNSPVPVEIVNGMPQNVLGVIDQLSQDPSVLEVWLIGSRVNMSATTDSDWDLLVFSTKEPYETLAREKGVDVLWKGPSGKVLLEGQPECMKVCFSDFQWAESESDKAAYVGRKFVDCKSGEVRDASEPAQVRGHSLASRIWVSSIGITSK